MALSESLAAEVDLLIEDEAWIAKWGDRATLERFVARAVRAALAAAHTPDLRLIVSVLLADNDRIAALNAAFRKLNRPTDVLSWPNVAWPGPASPAEIEALGDGAPLGDIALALEKVASDADSYARALEHHAAHLIVHGILHLLGYDHEDDESAAAMEAVEDAALRALGLPGRDA
ncbi:MAG: rRNA maturation RNase YbeY [Neomegalonema sp.]|nr:rRNA maturation RNase YbeY [Neomegalonema sp.]